MSSDELRKTIADMFLLALLSSNDLMTLPAAHGQLQTVLKSRSAPTKRHRSSPIVLTLTQNLCNDQEDEKAAMEFTKRTIDSERS